jgi:ferritin-like metal-binding protein YciE
MDAHSIEEQALAQLRRVAERAEDEPTVEIVSAILDEERAVAAKLEGAFDRAVAASLEAVGVAGGA